MAITFDAANKVITLDTFNVSASQLWSRWVDWVVVLDNSKYLPAFSQLGGVAPVALYLYLENGWRVRPQEANGTTKITGNLLVQGGGDPVVQTVGNWNALVSIESPFAAQAISVGSGLTASQDASLAAIESAAQYSADTDGGKWEYVGTQMIYYKPDGTLLATFNMFDANGVLTADPAMAYKRVPA